MMVMDGGGETDVEAGWESRSMEDESESVRDDVELVTAKESSGERVEEGLVGGIEGSSGGMTCVVVAGRALMVQGSA